MEYLLSSSVMHKISWCGLCQTVRQNKPGILSCMQDQLNSQYLCLSVHYTVYYGSLEHYGLENKTQTSSSLVLSVEGSYCVLSLLQSCNTPEDMLFLFS